MQIWLVEIATGVYEDKRTEILRVFSSLKAAEQCKTALHAELVTRKLARDADELDVDFFDSSCEFYGFPVDYNGAWLYIRGPLTVE